MRAPHIVVVDDAGSLTIATCDQLSTMISPDHAVRSPLVVAIGTSVNWNSRRFEMPSATGEAV